MSRYLFGLIILGLVFILIIGPYGQKPTEAINIQNDNPKFPQDTFSDLSYYPNFHNFSNRYEGIVANTTFEIWNSGCCGLTYSLIEECSWVSVNPQGGHSYGEHDIITVTINTTGLNFGSHTCDILIDSSDIDGIFKVKVNIIKPPNNAPTRPNLDGPLEGKYGEEYNFTANSNDSDGDPLWYKWDWDDGNYSNWIGPYDSNEDCTSEHIWSEEGDYTIKVKAKDINDEESDWSDPLQVSMPKNKPFITHFYQLIKWFFNLFPICIN